MVLEECLEFSVPLTTNMVPVAHCQESAAAAAAAAEEKATSAVRSPLPTHADASFFFSTKSDPIQMQSRCWRND